MLDILGMLGSNAGEATEVIYVEGEKVCDPVDVHRGHKPGVIDLQDRDPRRSPPA
jgi:hypothetical protein